MYNGLDVEHVYASFNREIWAGTHPEPKNREAALIAYVKWQATAANVPANYKPGRASIPTSEPTSGS